MLYSERTTTDRVCLVFVFLVTGSQRQLVDEVKSHGSLANLNFERNRKCFTNEMMFLLKSAVRRATLSSTLLATLSEGFYSNKKSPTFDYTGADF